ncbi:MAG TPA: hypothetical protein VEK10_12465 [Steroidobacteraceae bacterium]|nr:hypothetical protein [Steroidobacteraceae bacterium]
MYDESSQEGGRRLQPALAARRAPSAPSSSRMFASYLADVEQLLDEQRYDAALREALDLPRIAVALADPQLRSSGDRVRTWCEEWLRPPGAERDAHGLEFERLGRTLIERIGQLEGIEGVPMKALRQLQLRRHARTPTRGFRAPRSRDLSARETETVETCSALLEAARRWYARHACHDPIVQANLARLAVLR